jgi:hypothetical protein
LNALRTAAHRAGVAQKDEERGLEGVVGVRGVAQETPAHPEHAWPVPLHQEGERRVLAAPAEAVEQLGVT